MQNSRSQYLVRTGCGALMLLVAACGSDDSPSMDQSVSTAGKPAGTTSSAGRSGSTANPSTAGRPASTSAGAGGKSSGTLGAAGKAGTAGPSGSAGHSAADEDAGVSHDAGASTGAAGHAGGAGQAGTVAAGSGGSSGAQSATFKQVYAVLMQSCAGATCHVGTTRFGDNLSFADQATAYMNLVDTSAVSCQGAKRVVASDPDKSELVHTLKHTALAGCARTPKMPDNKPMLAQADIDLIVSWVKAGAKND